MVECMFICPHNISIFTCVNDVYIYQLSERSKNPQIYHRVKAPSFTAHWSTQVFLHIWANVFISYLDLLMCPFCFILLTGEKHL